MKALRICALSFAVGVAIVPPEAFGQAFVVESGSYKPPVAKTNALPVWSYQSDKTLHAILSEWADRAGWIAVFEPSADVVARQYRPAVGGSLRSSDFTAVVAEFMEGLDSSVPLSAELRTGNQPQILYITSGR